MKKLVTAFTISTVIGAGAVSTVLADNVAEQSQSQEQSGSATAECTTSGAYGQSVECRTEVELEQKQEQSQKVILENQIVYVTDIPEHDITAVDTGFDFQTGLLGLSAGTGLLAAGLWNLRK